MRNTTQYKLAGPKTFRRASSKLFRIWGGNVQNVEKSMRAVYIPDGYSPSFDGRCKYFLETGDATVFNDQELETLRVFLQVDQSGAEALIVAYDSTAGDYRQLFIHNVKPHVYVALKLFKDIWPRKAHENGLTLSADDIEILAVTPIASLKKNPQWRDVDLLIKSSDNWSLTERYYYLAKQTVHCVDDQTEVLTPGGWKFVEQFMPTDLLAVYGDGRIFFENPSVWHTYPYQGDMIRFVGEEVDQCVTPNHKMLYESNGKLHTAEAQYVRTLGRVNIPTSGYYDGGHINLPDWQVKLLVAIQADGHIESDNCVRFKFAKDRKINRLHDILNEGKLKYGFNAWVDETTAGNIVSDFRVTCPDLIKLFNGTKQWGSWLLVFSRRNMDVLVDELSFWDGSYSEEYSHKREYYCSSIYQNIDWVKTILHLSSKQGTISAADNNERIGINSRTNSIAKKKYTEQYIGNVYCPTVSTGAFLIRRNGKISITKNSGNYDIQWAMFQMNILEKSGGKIVIDREEAETFLAVYRGLFPEIPERNRRVRAQVDKTRTLFNLHGHPYTITNYNITESTYKEYYAWGPQSTVGEITRIAFSNLQYYIWDNHKLWDVLQDNHDSYLVQCPLMDVKECGAKMQEFMNQKLISPVDGTEFNMKSELQVGFCWAPYKKDVCELGLRELRW